MMIQAFFDGSTEKGKALIFSGYLAPVDSWLKFADDWGELLTIRPSLPAFKMSAVAITGNMERAMYHYRAIERANLKLVGCAVPIEPLERVVRDMNLEPAVANPYYLAWRAVVTTSIVAADHLGWDDPIEFIFDEQTEKVNIIKAWDYFYGTAPKEYRDRIKGCPSFKDDVGVLPLQAADLAAWWARKQYLADKSRMADMFPHEWTGGLPIHMLFTEVTEAVMRTQFTKDIVIKGIPFDP